MGDSKDGWMHRPLTMPSSTLQPDRRGIRESNKHNDLRQDNTISLPRSTPFKDIRPRANGIISPPPLKRQRTDNDIPRNSLSRSSQTNLPARLSSIKHDLVRRSFNGLPSSVQHEPNRRQNRDGALRHSYSFPAPPITQYREEAVVTVKVRESDVMSSDQSTSSKVTVKRACRVCEKSSATNYNPLFTCPGCARSYHDSCRKPPLIDGVEMQRWRCYKCLSGRRGRTSTACSTQGESRRSSATPSTLPSKLRQSTSEELGDNRASFLDISQNRVSSFPLPDHSSQPLLVHSNRQAEAALPVVDSGLTCTSAKHETLSIQSRNPFCLHTSMSSARYRLNGVGSSDSVERVDDWDQGPVSSEPICTSKLNIVEISNTPTQRSSEIELSGLRSESRPDNAPEAERDDDSLLAVDQPLTGIIAVLTVLCATCRIQRVFAKNQGESIRCHNCRNRSLIAETGKLEIPETPQVVSQTQMHATQSPLDSLGINSSPVSSNDSVMPWFQSNLVTSKPKIKQKKVSDEVILSPVNVLGESILERHHNEETSQVADTIEQVLVRQEVTYVNVAPPKQGITEPVCTPVAVERVEDPVVIGGYSDNAKISSESLPLPVFAKFRETSDGDYHLDSGTAKDNEAYPHDEVAPLQSIETELSITSHTGYASPDTRASSERSSKRPDKGATENRYTIRELAIIALVAAGDWGLTAVEITDWLAKTFTHLQKGKGPWESAIKTKLSALADFRCDRIPGAGHNTKRYSFSDASTLAQYRTEFAEYCNVITTPVSEASGTSGSMIEPLLRIEDTGLPPSIRIKKTATFTATYPPIKSLRTPGALCSAQYTPAMLPENLSMPSMPFERAVQRTPEVHLSLSHDSERETSYEAFLKAQIWAIESMTEDDKTRKIAQIKARPSRKQFFGTDHRLGHVRRYGRQDIHDESDGAWRPPPSERSIGQAKDSEDTSISNRPTLREVFDLPGNAIPMNDGQTELAFRDGTRINGRLPRSRQIYKVGKMSGGELTSRTS